MAERIGEQFGNYRLTRLLGRGGFADVYLADHMHLQIQAAVKVLHMQLTTDHFEHFRQEARLIAHLQHPHIVRVLDFDLKGATPFLVMDYAPGGTLRTRHARGMRVPLAQVVTYVKQVAAALFYAHQQHLVHRDVKPENMLLNQRNEVLLSDFGLAIIQPSSISSITQNGAGTPAYMAPEQIRGKPCAASDQYALAVVVYEWLCGEAPFRGSVFEVWYQHLHSFPPRLSERVPGLPTMVDDVILEALAKDPGQRFASIQEFAEALETAAFSTELYSLPHLPIREHWTTQPLLEHTAQQAQLPIIAASQGEESLAVEAVPPLFSPRSQAMGMEQGMLSPGDPYHRRLLVEQPGAHPSRQRRPGSRWLSFAGIAALILCLLFAGLYGPAWVRQLSTPTQAPVQQKGPGRTPTQPSQGPTPVPTLSPQAAYTRYTSGPPTQTDPLLDGSAWQWFDNAPTFGTCAFSQGAYHASPAYKGAFASCSASNGRFDTFAYQVQVAIQKGDAAGLLVNYQPTTPYRTFDGFLFCRDTGKFCMPGSVWFTHAQGGGSNCQVSTNFDCNATYPFINTALRGQNTLTIIVLSQTIYLYINGHSVGVVPRVYPGQGGIGVIAYEDSNSTDATFSHAKLWILPG